MTGLEEMEINQERSQTGYCSEMVQSTSVAGIAPLYCASIS